MPPRELLGLATYTQVNELFQFENWREKHSPAERSRMGVHSEKFWRYTFGTLDRADDFGSSFVKYGIRNPSYIITSAAEIIDGRHH